MLDFAIMTDEVLPPIAVWKVLLLAPLVPIGIAAGFLAVFAAADQPVSPAEFQADPLMGQKIADPRQRNRFDACARSACVRGSRKLVC